jgi:tetratricopeptide (TPR) repeat protein
MPDAIDELYARWKQRPDPANTVALCDALRGEERARLVAEVGEFATRELGANLLALLAAGRMYMENSRFDEAQTAIVNAGRVAPREGGVYRLLGEVLLRRGDADRAEKVFERAIQFGVSDPDTQMWLERARVFKVVQARGGSRAVAAEVARSAPLGKPAAAPAPPAAKKPPPMRPPMDSEAEKPTLARDVPPELKPHLDELREQSNQMLRKELNLPGKAEEPKVIIGGHPADGEANTEALEPRANAAAAGDKLNPPLSPHDTPTSAAAFASVKLPSEYAQDLPGGENHPAVRTGRPPPSIPDPGSSAPNPFTAQAASGPNPFAAQATSAPNPFVAPPPPVVPDARVVPRGGELPNPFGKTSRDLGPGLQPGKAKMPDPRDVLDALALAGVFEPPQAGPRAASWDRPERTPGRRRGSVFLTIVTVLFVAGGVGLFFFVRDRRNKAHLEAESVLARVETEMAAGKPQSFGAIEQSIGRAFDLESRSPRAALVWLRERALVGLVRGGGDIAFEDAVARAKEVGVPESKVAFGYVASFLFQGDTAGAAAVLPKWDGPAGEDAWYQLLAGATLERAGDPRAIDRYAAAARLDPTSVVAEISLARAIAIDGDAQKAAELAKAFRVKYTDRPEGIALLALAWGRDPMHGEPPPEVNELARVAPDLPVSLKAVPFAVAALRAVEKHAPADARAEVTKGLAVVTSPGMATWLGDIAIEAGDEQLARKAALSAVSFSAVYPPARVLAARVALLGGRLDEALKAVDELDQASPPVAIVRAAASYERADSDGLGRAWSAIPQEMRSAPYLRGLSIASEVLEGRVSLSHEKLVDLAASEAPWGDIIAMDLALDAGDVATADKIASTWGDDPRPPRALRLARLARYEGKLDVADKMLERALVGTVTARVLFEQIYLLVAKEKAGEVAALLKKYPLVLGSLSSWAAAYGVASSGKAEEARAKTTTAELPPASAPLPARLIVASALGAMKDRRRAGDIVKSLLASGIVNPDVGAAAVAAGFKKVEGPGKKVTYVQ